METQALPSRDNGCNLNSLHLHYHGMWFTCTILLILREVPMGRLRGCSGHIKRGVRMLYWPGMIIYTNALCSMASHTLSTVWVAPPSIPSTHRFQEVRRATMAITAPCSSKPAQRTLLFNLSHVQACWSKHIQLEQNLPQPQQGHRLQHPRRLLPGRQLQPLHLPPHQRIPQIQMKLRR